MVHKPWVLPQLVIRHIKVPPICPIDLSEVGFGPSDPELQYLKRIHIGRILPAGVKQFTGRIPPIRDILITVDSIIYARTDGEVRSIEVYGILQCNLLADIQSTDIIGIFHMFGVDEGEFGHH
jgi:hypothetical protein